jgi:hypothetical protein
VKRLLAVVSVLFTVVYAVNFGSFCLDEGRSSLDRSAKHASEVRSAPSGRSATSDFLGNWRGSPWQEVSVLAAAPFEVLAIASLWFQFLAPAAIYSDATAMARLERGVRASGPASVSLRCGGRVGAVNYFGRWHFGLNDDPRLFRVEVHPQGLWIRPRLMPAFAIESSTIAAMKLTSGNKREGVEIHHTSSEIDTPVVLWCGDCAELLPALERMAGKRVDA